MLYICIIIIQFNSCLFTWKLNSTEANYKANTNNNNNNNNNINNLKHYMFRQLRSSSDGTRKAWNSVETLPYGTWIHIEPVGYVKCCAYWDISLCSPMKVNRCYGGTYRFHLQDWRVSEARKQQAAVLIAACFMLVCWLVYSLSLKMEEICLSETSADFRRRQKFSCSIYYRIFRNNR
jgi:hypothetical protein